MQQRRETRFDRSSAVDKLYKAMTHLMRRRAEVGAAMHPELSLVGFTLLAEIEEVPGTRPPDLPAVCGLETWAASRELKALEDAGFLRRESERTGRRGYDLVVTPTGK